MEQTAESQKTPDIRNVYLKEPRSIDDPLPYTVYKTDGTWYDCSETHAEQMKARIKHGK